jgi:feruloyl esterase
MERWVEQGTAPNRLHASHLSGDHGVPPMIHMFPVDPTLEVFSRPVFPYPAQARYSGRGDPMDEMNFQASSAPDSKGVQ